MEFIGQFVTFLIIPTGATTGQRITINVGNDGAIKVYNSAGQNTVYIGGSSGVIESIDPVSSNVVELISASVKWIPATDPTGLGAVIDTTSLFGGPVGVNLQLTSGVPSLAVDPSALSYAKLNFLYGLSGGGGTAAFAAVALSSKQVRGGSANLPAYYWTSGAILKCGIDASFLETWFPMAGLMNAGWTSTGFQVRLDALDNLVLNGRVDYTGASSTVAGAAVITTALAAKYMPAANQQFNIAHFTSGMVTKNTQANAIVNSTGTISLFWGDGVAGSAHDVNGLATNDRFYFNNTVPLGNIT